MKSTYLQTITTPVEGGHVETQTMQTADCADCAD